MRALRTDPNYRDVPIVLVTSKDARIDAVRGYDAGADAYLTKSADAEELIPQPGCAASEAPKTQVKRRKIL